MIDLHCHILPALDDGALDLADSVAMAREAERRGCRSVVRRDVPAGAQVCAQ
jgi:protein-tyrosine phosphatase